MSFIKLVGFVWTAREGDSGGESFGRFHAGQQRKKKLEGNSAGCAMRPRLAQGVKPTGKPGSVVDSHSSRRFVT